MSYSESYSASVPFSGSVSYSYPASQSGGSGTAYYSGSVPVYVTINVNTRPFDGSVDRFNQSIGVLTGTVAGMKTAQCLAIQQTGEEVSAAIINGFFGTIKTELSQQIQALDSAMQAGLGLLIQQGKAVANKQNVMEGDYHRISSRYIKLFDDLDNECYKRIFTLDKPSFNLSEKVQKELLSESSSNTAALNLLGIEEISSSKTLLFISSLNRKAHDVLKTMHDYITQESRINLLVNSFLINDEIENKIPFYLPVIWTESDMLEDNNINRESFIPDCVSREKNQIIAETVDGFCSGALHSEWKEITETGKEALNSEFNALAESCFTESDDEMEQRVYRTMLSLWQSAHLLTLDRSV
ncbi:MAG: hypothetical protein FWG89_05955 [Treponema sp.]|nr:hypothetical protein [Treponema sp.]